MSIERLVTCNQLGLGEYRRRFVITEIFFSVEESVLIRCRRSQICGRRICSLVRKLFFITCYLSSNWNKCMWMYRTSVCVVQKLWRWRKEVSLMWEGNCKPPLCWCNIGHSVSMVVTFSCSVPSFHFVIDLYGDRSLDSSCPVKP
jgi:hypothetical protein